MQAFELARTLRALISIDAESTVHHLFTGPIAALCLTIEQTGGFLRDNKVAP